MALKVYIDGGTHCSNICVVVPELEKVVVRHRKHTPTNNELEYLALLFVLESSWIRGYQCIEIYTDSQLMANQINGKWVVKNDRLRALRDKCEEKMTPGIKLLWIPRKKNLAGIHLENLKKRPFWRWKPLTDK